MYYNINPFYFRNLVVGVNYKVPLNNGDLAQYINFDNAATTPAFLSVMNKINRFAPWYSSIHRGSGYKSKVSTDIYDICRVMVTNFVKADLEKDRVIFVKNTTEAINKLSYLLSGNKEKDVIISTFMEHHSNDLPWRNKFKIVYVNVDKDGKLCMEDLEYKLKEYEGRVQLVAITGASNVTGYVNPVHKVAKLSHKYGAKILVDGAQLIPHMSFTMKPHCSPDHIDFLAFSAHKMYAPFGSGVLIGPKEVFDNTISEQVGGGTIKIVTPKEIIWSNSPENQEAGTPNLMGALALSASINTLNFLGMDNIHKYEDSMKKYTLYKLSKIKDIEIYCKENSLENNVSIIPFNIRGLHHETVAKALSDQWAIGVRSGCFCAHPYVEKLLKMSDEEIQYMIKNPDKPKPGMVRLSFGLYNNFREIDILIEALKYIVNNKELYL